MGFEPHGPGKKEIIPSVFAERSLTLFSCTAAMCSSQVGLVEPRARVGGEEGSCSNNTVAAILKMSKRQMPRDGRVRPGQAR